MRILRLIGAVIIIFCLYSGTVRPVFSEEKLAVGTNVNMTDGLGQATVILQARPFRGATGQGFYRVLVDDQPALYVARLSDTNLALDPGTHTIIISAVKGSSEPRANEPFGKSSYMTFDVAKGELIMLEYIGPRRSVDAGKLVRK